MLTELGGENPHVANAEHQLHARILQGLRHILVEFVPLATLMGVWTPATVGEARYKQRRMSENFLNKNRR